METEPTEHALAPFSGGQDGTIDGGTGVARRGVTRLGEWVPGPRARAGGVQGEPLRQSPSDHANRAPEVARRSAADATPPEPCRRALVVDDHAGALRINGALLSRLGYTATLASSGPAALELLGQHEHGFDLLLTDVSMPGMSGLELARRVRAIRPSLPIVVASGYTDDELRSAFAAVGVSAILPKPFGRQELASALGALATEG